MISPIKAYAGLGIAVIILIASLKFMSMRQELTELNGQVTTLQRDKQDLESTVRMKDEQVKKKQKEIDALELANKNQKKKIDELNQQKEVYDATLKSILDKNNGWARTPLPDELRKHLQSLQKTH